MSLLYHYTCSHRASGIEQTGYVASLDYLQGQPSGMVGAKFAWFTDLDIPHPRVLGLTSFFLDCDRTECRFRVTDDCHIMRYLDVRRRFRSLWPLEEVPGVMPAHWWLASEPVPAVKS